MAPLQWMWGQKWPEWDVSVLKKLDFAECRADLTSGRRILGEADLMYAPMFGIFARK